MPNRRHFISTVLGAGAAGFATAQTAANLDPRGENIQFGLVTYMWGADWDLPTLIQNCEDTKVLGVELRVEHAHKVDPTLTAQQRADVRQRFEDSPVDVLGMGTNFEFHSPDAEEVKKNIAGAKDYVKLSHDIGGTGVKVKPNNLPKDVPVDKTLEQIGKSLAVLGDYAMGFGQEIRLEVHGGVTDLAYIRKIMEVAGRDNVRVCWNSNKNDLDKDGIEANFNLVKDYLGHTTHVRELNGADYPWAKLMELFVKADYDGWILMEAHSKPEDRVAALAQQKQVFTDLIAKARRTA